MELTRGGKRVIPYFFLLPAFSLIMVFKGVPLLVSVALSLTRWNLNGFPQFIGLSNYGRLLDDSLFWTSVANTVYYTVGTLIPAVILSLALALILNQSWFRGRVFFRGVYFLPVVCSMVAVSLVWSWIYDPVYGLLNYALVLLGMEPQSWLFDVNLAMPSLILLAVWKNLGYNMVLYLAGLQGIPQNLLEASRIDGANWVQSLWYVTLPLLRRTTLFVVIMQMIRSFQLFAQVYVMTQGGPVNRTQVIVYYLYQNAFEWFKMGYGSTIAVALFVIVFGLTCIQLKAFGD